MAGGLQISSPLESINESSGERVGINLGSRRSRVSFHLVKLAFGIHQLKHYFIEEKKAGYDLHVP